MKKLKEHTQLLSQLVAIVTQIQIKQAAMDERRMSSVKCGLTLWVKRRKR